jgi:hypothetical protein
MRMPLHLLSRTKMPRIESQKFDPWHVLLNSAFYSDMHLNGPYPYSAVLPQ